MSRVGKTIIKIPAGVQVTYANRVVTVTKGNNTLTREIRTPIEVEIQNDEIKVTRGNDVNLSRSLHGLYNRLIQNMIQGVTQGYSKYLILNGVGYKAALKGEDLVLNLGYSHPIEVKSENGIKFKVLTPAEVNELNLGKEGVGTVVAVNGIDKEKVGLMAGKIRDLRPVEPYHMYGIRYRGERVRRKESKSGAKSAK
ncbi:MAG: 50S ribosomal protein L6 [Prevotella sp.]|nr:50S ribosomal protein L6 [Prevotella sp.]